MAGPTSIRLDDEILAAVDAEARRLGTSRGRVIEAVLVEWMADGGEVDRAALASALRTAADLITAERD